MAKKTVILPRPFQHQKAVHDEISSSISNYGFNTEKSQQMFIVKAQRQVGKTALATSELSRFSLGYSGLTNAYIAPTFKLCKKLYREIYNMYQSTGLISYCNKTDLVIEFTTGGVINFFSAEQRDNLRGFNVTGIMVIDEAAFIPDDVYYYCLMPWVDFHKARTLIISTPKFKSGFFYKLFKNGDLHSDKYISVDFCDYNMDCVRTKEQLDEKRKVCPQQVFISEYLGQFLDAISEVFGKFDNIISDNCPSIDSAKELFFGLDWGTGSGEDSTVLTALNENGEQCYLWSTNDMPPTAQAEYVRKIYDRYNDKIKRFKVELNSIGKIYYNMIHTGRPKIKGFTTTNESKRKIVNELQLTIQSEHIMLSSDVDQQMQLSMYTAKVNEKTNSVSYNAPSGFHDDKVMALMLANSDYYNTKIIQKKYNIL